MRIGEHDQTAFALGLILDYARGKNDERLTKLAADSARKFFLADTNCPLAYEPSGEDFLSPCLGEADVMRRVLPQGNSRNGSANSCLKFRATTANADWLPVAISPDPSDPKLAHLDGLNLSRAWMLEGILSALAGQRCTPSGFSERSRSASARWARGGNRRTLRRRTLARELCGLSHHKARD